MRTPAWMIAYSAVIVLSSASYAALVLVGQWLALVCALAALVAVIAAVVLTVSR